MSTDMTVANTILEQLGGRRFVVMTGCRDFVGSENALKFRIPKAKDGINCCEIKLEPSDTYTVRFVRVGDRRTGYRVTEKSVHEDIYNDSLVELFERVTGLYTHL